MTINQVHEIEELFNLRKTISRQIENIQNANYVSFGGNLSFFDYGLDDPISEPCKKVVDACIEAAKTALIKYRDSLTEQLKELGLEE